MINQKVLNDASAETVANPLLMNKQSEESDGANDNPRILVYISTRLFEGGGLSAVILNYSRQLWTDGEYADRFLIDFVSHGPIEWDLLKEIESHGGKYFELPSRKRHPLRHARAFAAILKKNSYDVLHLNYDSGFDTVELALARKYVPVRICHVHNSRPRYRAVNALLKPIVHMSYTKAIACSRAAGEALFGRDADFEVLNNAIDVRKFAYNQKVRTRMREELRLDDRMFCVGSVGRMNSGNPKNTGFLIRAYMLAHRERPDAKLVIVGDGELKKQWVSLAEELGVSDSVTFAGFRTNVADYLQAFDVFCFPSKWEGLGMAAIEAQAAGLSVLVSDAVPVEVGLSDSIEYLPIGEGCESVWAERIVELMENGADRSEAAKRSARQIRDGGYDITTEAMRLGSIYCSSIQSGAAD